MGIIEFLRKSFSRPSSTPITSLEGLLLRISGMRTTVEYEIRVGDVTTLSLYTIVYSENTERVLEKRVSCDPRELTALLNSCGVSRWNGFHGRHPSGVSDGVMFNLSAVVNGGERITANGSARFPKGYRDMLDSFDRLLGNK